MSDLNPPPVNPPPVNPPPVNPPPVNPPPPMPVGGAVTKAPGIGWLAVAGGVLGLLALFLPWFDPKLGKAINGISERSAVFHSWSGFRVFVIAPVLLIVFAVMWAQAIQGRHNSRYAGSADPVRSLGLASALAGGVVVAMGLLSIVIMKFHYRDWDEASSIAKSAGTTLQKNPQPGLYLLLVGGAILAAVGVFTLLAGRRAQIDAAGRMQA